MSTPRKFRPGRVITTPSQLMTILFTGHHIYFRGKFQHNGWARGWQIGAAMTWLERGYLVEALPMEITP